MLSSPLKVKNIKDKFLFAMVSWQAEKYKVEVKGEELKVTMIPNTKTQQHKIENTTFKNFTKALTQRENLQVTVMYQ